MNELPDANIDPRTAIVGCFTSIVIFHFRITNWLFGSDNHTWGEMQEDIFDNLDKTQQARGTGISLHVGNVKV